MRRMKTEAGAKRWATKRGLALVGRVEEGRVVQLWSKGPRGSYVGGAWLSSYGWNAITKIPSLQV